MKTMADSPLRILFAGTPSFAASHLKHLIATNHQILAVYTQPDRRAGRGRTLHASPVKKMAEAAGLTVCQPASLKSEEAQQQLAAFNPDVMIVVAYGLILPQAVLDTPRLGCLNVHASLLPRWRGAAPIQRAIEAGDDETGITIMQMDAGLDTGEMLGCVSCPINSDTNAGSLHDQLAELGPPLLNNVLYAIGRQQQRSKPQRDEFANYAHKILKSEAQIDWRQSASVLDYKIRAFNPFPMCYCDLNGHRIRIWQARPLVSTTNKPEPGIILRADKEGISIGCGEGELVIEVLQLEGGKPLEANQLLSAYQTLFAAGQRFTLPLTGVDK